MRKQFAPQSNNTEIAQLGLTGSPEEIIARLNLLINQYSITLKTLSFKGNFDGIIMEDIIIPANSPVTLSHLLGIKPKWRILLRQEGNGVITDIPSEWNDKVITLYNNGAVDVIVSVFIARE